jgi:2'-5' RNA ligase
VTARPDEAPSRANPRLFIAIPIADEARVAVEAIVDAVRSELDSVTAARPGHEAERRSAVRWVRMDGLHLTLRFLGPTASERVAELASAVDEVARVTTPFEVILRGAGAFPSPTRPRALWIGMGDGRVQLTEMAGRLSSRLADAGVPRDERPFKAHLTLGRTDGRREGPAAAQILLERADTLRIAFRADRLVLFESVTGGGPARYVPLHEAPFGAR